MSHDCSSCESDNDDGPITTVTYELNKETEVPKTKGQLFKTVLLEGKPGTAPQDGAKVSVHYVGTLATDGSTFDSSRDRGEPFEFTIGQGQVIKGWDKGVATMNKGEKAVLKCLPEFAYGASGSPPKIPPESTLNFEVELLDWSKLSDISPEHNHSIIKDVTKEGSGYDTPDYETQVTYSVTAAEWVESDDGHETGKAGAVYFSKNDATAVIGVDDLPVALEIALKSMKRDEQCIVIVTSQLVDQHKAAIAVPEKTPGKTVYGTEEDTKIQPGKKVRYELTLNNMVKIETWSAKGEDKLKEATKRKEEANAFFVAGKMGKAEGKYRRALEFISSDYDLSDEQKAEVKKLQSVLNSNLGQVYINLRKFDEALEKCNKALEQDPKNTKALFRRAKCLNCTDEWDEAIKDLTHILELDPQNAPAQAEMNAVKAKRSAYDKQMKSRYQKMFA